MDVKLLQATLKEFAAEREWGSFHTPKNLSMALIVEAAELVEIFQWMTAEQSQQAHRDPVIKTKISDEIADIFLYLVQIADLSAIELEEAVARKIEKNSVKYPPSLGT